VWKGRPSHQSVTANVICIKIYLVTVENIAPTSTNCKILVADGVWLELSIYKCMLHYWLFAAHGKKPHSANLLKTPFRWLTQHTDKRELLLMFCDFMVLCKCSLKIILTSLYLVEGLAWWDWPFTWCTDQLLSFSAWHCWLGHLTRKNRARYDL